MSHKPKEVGGNVLGVAPTTPLININSTHIQKPKKSKKSCCHPTNGITRLFVLIAPSFFFFSIFATDDIVGSAVPTLKNILDLSSLDVSILYVANPIVSLFTTMIFGVTLKYIGIRLASVVSSLAILGGTLLFIWSPNYWGKVAGRAIFGAGMGPLEILAELIFLRWFDDAEDDKGKNLITTELAFGVLASAGMLGSVVAFNFVPYMLDVFHDSLRPALTVVALIPTVSFVLSMAFYVIDLWATPILELDEREEEEQGFLEALKTLSWGYWVLVVMTGTTWSMIYIMLIYTTDYLDQKWGLDNLTSGRYTSVTFAIAIVVSPMIGMIIQRKGQVITLLVIGSVFLTASALFFGLCTPDYHPLIALSGFGLSVAVFEPTLYTAIAAVIPEPAETVAFSINSLVFQVMLCLPVVIGFMNDALGSYDILTYLMAALAGLSIVLSFLLGYLEPGLQKAGQGPGVKLFYRPVVISHYSRKTQKHRGRRRAKSVDDISDIPELRNVTRASDISGSEDPLKPTSGDSGKKKKHPGPARYLMDDPYKSVSVPPSFWSAFKDTEVQVVPVNVDDPDHHLWDVSEQPDLEDIWKANPLPGGRPHTKDHHKDN